MEDIHRRAFLAPFDHDQRDIHENEGQEGSDGGEISHPSQRHREQPRNVADCLDRLSDVIRGALTPPKRRRPTRTPRSAVAKRLDVKKRRSQTKQMRQRPDA